MNKYPKIEFHILQSFPVSCLNRDDLGSPKTCLIGGVNRARVSSQCWKRAVRMQLHELGVNLGIRSKKIADILRSKMLERGASEEVAAESAEKISAFLSDDSLIFLSSDEYQDLVDYAESKQWNSGEYKDKEVQKLIKKLHTKGLNGLDIALFGRMVAKAPVMNVEAAASFSHAFSTHSVNNELDFFTALDDVKDEQGSAHMGSSEFTSATYYRYISLDVQQLCDTLGIDSDADLQHAIESFVKALYLAVPTARQATMSASNLWDFARIYVRNGQRMQCTFERPVKAAREGGYLEESIKVLKNELDHKEAISGSLFGKIASFEFGETNSLSIDELIQSISKAVLERA